MDITQATEEFVLHYEEYALIIIFLLALLHPLTENPWSFLTMTLGITFFGGIFGYVVVLFGNIAGILILYVLAHGINKGTKYFLLKKKLSKKILDWINKTETWRHIIVIGMPMIPTYPIKIALPFSNMTFKKYLMTMIGSYLFLYVMYTLPYYSILGLITNTIPPWLSFIFLLLFALYIYFGRTLRKQFRSSTEEAPEQV